MYLYFLICILLYTCAFLISTEIMSLLYLVSLSPVYTFSLPEIDLSPSSSAPFFFICSFSLNLFPSTWSSPGQADSKIAARNEQGFYLECFLAKNVSWTSKAAMSNFNPRPPLSFSTISCTSHSSKLLCI